MDALPQVGQKYQHKKWGKVVVHEVLKRGRGYAVEIFKPKADDERGPIYSERLKDFQKATQ